MTELQVSVIIDTYNYGGFIEESIDSVLSQEFPRDRMEVLVVDDGSTDDTAERVKKYGSQVEYLYKPNGGQASAFNWGLNRAHGEIVFFLDADDYWLPGKVQRVVSSFEDKSVGMVYHKYLLSDSAPSGSVPSHLDLVSGDVLRDMKSVLQYRIFPTSCLAFRREALDRLLPVPAGIRLQADGYLALLIVFVAPVLGLSEYLTVYRMHGGNSYTVNTVRNTPEVQRQRRQIWNIIWEESHLWLARNGFDPGRREIRAFLDQLLIFWESVEFPIIPPSRLQLFSHLLRYNRIHRSQQNWKLTVLNYLSAITALARGYKRPNRQIGMIPEGTRRA